MMQRRQCTGCVAHTSSRISLATAHPAVSRHRRQCRPVAAVSSSSGSAQALDLFSPSKINLFLRVIRRREDGFHDLASLFHVIDLGDSMSFATRASDAQADTLSCSDPSIPSDERNLVIKALNLFRRKTGVTQFFDVTLEKQVPHGAGLGGGSGNAATTLWAANELSGRPASNAQLLQWSGDIGSDISVFFSEGAAYCTGRGEVVENVPPPLPLTTPLLLVKPPVGLSTPMIFKSLDLSRRSNADPLQLLSSMSEQGLNQSLCVNDLEQPAFDNLPSLAELKQQLISQGGDALQAVFMTGSGSTIVCAGSDAVPGFLAQQQDLFVSPARLITRQPGQWYTHSGMWSAAAAPAQKVAVAH